MVELGGSSSAWPEIAAERAAEWRRRLTDLSWFMHRLNEQIAPRRPGLAGVAGDR